MHTGAKGIHAKPGIPDIIVHAAKDIPGIIVHTANVTVFDLGYLTCKDADAENCDMLVA